MIVEGPKQWTFVCCELIFYVNVYIDLDLDVVLYIGNECSCFTCVHWFGFGCGMKAMF